MNQKRPNTKSIIRELRKALSSATWSDRTANGRGDEEWTKEILQALAGLAHKYTLTPRYAKRHHSKAETAQQGELLLDMVWLDQTEEPRNVPRSRNRTGLVMRDVVLACECELNFGSYGERLEARRRDFQKLLMVRSSFRLFICQESHEANRLSAFRSHDSVLATLMEWLVAFPHAQDGDEMLMIVLDYRSQDRSMTYRRVRRVQDSWSIPSEPDPTVIF